MVKKSIVGLIFIAGLYAPAFAHEVKDGEEHHHHTHQHSALEVPAERAPRITEVKVSKDPVGGFNLFVATENFEFAPEQVNRVHADGRGHAHVYVDGVKIARIYGPAYHIETLATGERQIEVTLNANDHREFAVNGTKVAAATTFVVP